jgi:hypothetical protein
MICLWALSPIAGQSFGRMLDTITINNSTMRSVGFSDFAHLQQGQGAFTDSVGGAAAASAAALMNLLYASALYTRNANPLWDIWGNALIPYNDSTTVQTHLLGYPHQDYTSYIGMQLPDIGFQGTVGVNATPEDATYHNTTVTLPYSSWVLQCNDPVNTTIDAINAATVYPREFNTHGAYYMYMLYPDATNTTWMAAIPPPSFIPLPTTNEDGSLNYSSSFDWSLIQNNTDPGRVFFAVNHTNITGDNYAGTFFLPEVLFYNCSYENQYLDVNFFCPNDAGCVATGTQRAPNTGNIYMTNSFVNSILNSLGTQATLSNWGYYSLFSQYLQNPLQGLGSVASYDVSGSQIASDTSLFATTLSKLLNTYNEISFDYQLLGASVSESEDGSSSSSSSLVNFNTTSATRDIGVTVYRMHWQWFTVLIFSCILLLVFGITGIILDSKTLGPDILGFASSLTRDNRYIKLENGDVETGGGGEVEDGSGKNAYETMRDLKHHKVMLQDVRGHEEVGKIALASWGLPTGKPLCRERLYR